MLKKKRKQPQDINCASLFFKFRGDGEHKWEGMQLWMRKQLKSVVTYNSRITVERWNNRGLLRNIRADKHRPVIQTGVLIITFIH